MHKLLIASTYYHSEAEIVNQLKVAAQQIHQLHCQTFPTVTNQTIADAYIAFHLKYEKLADSAKDSAEVRALLRADNGSRLAIHDYFQILQAAVTSGMYIRRYQSKWPMLHARGTLQGLLEDIGQHEQHKVFRNCVNSTIVDLGSLVPKR